MSAGIINESLPVSNSFMLFTTAEKFISFEIARGNLNLIIEGHGKAQS